MTIKNFRVQVYGKRGCDKCHVLNERLDKLLAQPEWQDFEKQYCDVETVDGLVAFSEAECVNPQRIPAFLVLRRRADSGDFEPIPAREPGKSDPAFRAAHLYQYVGLQTDYSESGRGLLTPPMIAAALTEARSA